MVGEPQRRLRGYQGHVAVNVVGRRPRLANGFRRPCGSGMTAGAAAVVIGGVLPAGGLMRIVAGETGERATALSEASALAQVDRLMTDIPRIAPVDGDALGGRRPVTSAAEFVQPRRRWPGRIPNGASRGLFGVVGSRAMAGFASYAELTWPSVAIGFEGHRSRGMAFEASGDPVVWI
jgi:hypothetical protein